MDIQASKAQIDSLNQQMADVKTTLKPNPADVNRLAEIEKTVLAPKRQELYEPSFLYQSEKLNAPIHC